MKKRTVSLICLIAVLLCAAPVLKVQTHAAENYTYQVGFARVDINPYIDPTLTGSALVAKENILEIPLYGSGTVWDRLSTYGLVDDNGDGVIDANDGLKATCICVTDDTGKTVLFISMDLIAGMMVNEVRQAICARVQQELDAGTIDNVILTEDQISYAGTHTHNAPAASVYSASGKTGFNSAGKDLKVINENLGIWIDRTVANVAEAAILALKDRAPAKLIKDQISASEVTTASVAGKAMNSVRHYNNYDANGNLICVAGDNFNDRGDNPKQITQVNDTMYLLRFDFTKHNASAADKKDEILLVNWRGHPSLNNTTGYAHASRNCVSSDYVNAFRYCLEYGCTIFENGTYTTKGEQVMRVAFFNGEGGNVNPRGREVINSKTREIAGGWIDKLATSNKTSRGTAYGRILCAMAQEGINTPDYRENVVCSNISNTQYYLYSARKETGMTALGYEAAKSFQALFAQNSNIKMPYVYTAENGETYVISSRYHANNIVSSWDTTFNAPVRGFVDMELNALKLGENLALITSSGEIFDYYYNEDGSNAWKNLNTGTYGTPFVFGYCNGFDYYVPNNKAYDYNLGSKEWARGCYEVSTSQYAQGTGERMVKTFGEMLDQVFNGTTKDREAYCQHCKETVVWQALNNKYQLDTGHYYLTEDTYFKQILAKENQQVCFDLNGYTYEGDSRAMYTRTNGGSTLNIMDSSAGQTGKLIGNGGTVGSANGHGGVTLLVDTGNTVNLYGGTLTAVSLPFRGSQTGGVIRVRGTLNMYGGTITGGIAQNFTGTYLKSGVPTEITREAYGASMYVDGKANIYGGRIESGVFQTVSGVVTGNATDGYRYTETVTEGTGKSPCVYVAGKLTVAESAYVEDAYFGSQSASRFAVNTNDNPFTGYVHLSLGVELPDSMKIGSCTKGTVLSEGTVVFFDRDLVVTAKEEGIYVSAGVGIVTHDGKREYYSSFENAYLNYIYSASAPSHMKLYADVKNNLSIGKTVYLDLNGHDITGGVNVSSDKTLYCMDSETDDYKVSDGVYGVISGKITGSIQAVPKKTVGAVENGYRFGYLMSKDDEGVSFHRVKLRVTNLSLRPSNVGMYYTAAFAGDEIAAAKVLEYGIALNAKEEPSAKNMTSGGTSLYVPQTAKWNGAFQLTSVMLANVMKPTNEVMLNIANAGDKVYACAYIKTEAGYIFSDTAAYSLRELVEIADEHNCIQDEAVAEMAKMYETYRDVMNLWNLPRLRMQMAQLAG